MADKAFLRIVRETTPPRPVRERLADFRAVYPAPDEGLVAEQSRRCMGCGVPFCQSGHGCPVENLIPDWNELVAKGRLRDACDLLHATNNFPEFTGTLCPAPCESACVLSLADQPVTIRQIELMVVNHGFQRGWIVPQPAARRLGLSVAVVGSGPAGLACAQQLARRGYDVTVYEKEDRPGGLLRYGIPDFKLEKWLLDRRLGQLIEEGVRFRTGVMLGRDVTVEDLSRQHHALCLAIGAEAPRDLPVEGRALDGVHFAMDYLTQQNRRLAGDALPAAPLTAKDKHVVVIGGGDTGSDCLGTALRQGARSVTQLELLGRPPEARAPGTPWPLWPLKMRTSHAHEEGGERVWSVATTGFSGQDGRVRRLHAVQVERRADGRFVPVDGTAFALDADLVLLAMGYTGIVRDAVAGEGLRVSPVGTLATDAGYMTGAAGVFAAGDARRGASLIVWAIAEGRRMAASVDRFLQQ